MFAKRVLTPILSNNAYSLLFFISMGVLPRAIVWAFFPLDWNWDSYHHWQISYLTLKIGLSQGRMWDLNGCEYYWGVVPHVVQAFLLWVLDTDSILPYRIFNVVLGGVNAYLVFLIGRDNGRQEVGFYAGILCALFPVAVVFDIIAMQETLALFFVLLAVYVFSSHPFLSGVSLALAAQSRTEFWLISAIFVVGAIIIERGSSKIRPFVISWLSVMAVFCLFFALQTSNAFYPLYWELYNSFGGWSKAGQGKSLVELMFSWTLGKLKAWPTRPAGAVLIVSMAACLGVFGRMVMKRWKRYHVYLFFMACLGVMGPLLVPYFSMQTEFLLLMLRLSMPLLALGLVVLVEVTSRFRSKDIGIGRRNFGFGDLLIVLSLLSYAYFVPAYGQFQRIPQQVFLTADQGMKYYRGGTIVCDYPILNYRLISEWNVSADSLLGNLYSPAYYGISDPIEFVRWFEKHNVTMWIYSDERAQTVWSVVNGSYPDLLVPIYVNYGMKFYSINQTALKIALAR
jgi:hypothetical protein